MQEYWELYMKPIDGNAASVLFNAGISVEFPIQDKGYVGFVKIPMKTPDERGLVSEEETDQLSFIEDKLEMEALRYRIGTYVGRIASAGELTFVYYLRYEFEWRDVVEAAMKAFPEYTFTFGSKPDPEWEIYQKLLFPTPNEWQIIQNHKVCDNLRESGDALHLPRAIEHHSYFPSSEERAAFIEAIVSEGFTVKKEFTADNGWSGVGYWRKDKPFYYDIDELTLSLIAISGQFAGEYDGWETSIVKM